MLPNSSTFPLGCAGASAGGKPVRDNVLVAALNDWGGGGRGVVSTLAYERVTETVMGMF